MKIPYSHCFPAYPCPEAWFPQRPKPSTLTFTPAEDAIVHLSVQTQVSDFTAPALAAEKYPQAFD
jgi:hypothetical protein